MQGRSLPSSESSAVAHPLNGPLVADGLITVAEAAQFLALSRSSLYVLMESGQVAYVKIGRARRIPRASVVALAAINLRGGWKAGSGS